MNTTRILSLVAVASLAAASQAVIFSYSGFTSTGASTSGSFGSMLLTVDGSGSPFNSITGATVTLSPTVGSATFLSSMGSLVLGFSAAPTGTQTPGFTSSSNVGTIGATSTGSFAQFAGSQVSVTSNTSTAGTNFFTVLGNVNPTPEPSAYAALGVGALALIRRRRKA